MTEQKPKIFLSYAHEDIGMAKRIYQDLKRYGLDVWFDNESLLPGQDWEKEIKKTIRESDYFIALLSDKCLSKRGFVHSELKLSFEIVERYFPSDTGIFILPVRLDECKPSDAYVRLGRLHWIDVFPETEYQNGLKKILLVVSPGTFLLRSKPMELSAVDVDEMIRIHGFYDNSKNPGGKGFSHQYKLEEIKGDKIVFDEISCLMWQQSGSSDEMIFEDAKKYIKEINDKRFASFSDWRLPTLVEAMSLVENKKKNGDLYIDPIFDIEKSCIWTEDEVQGESIEHAWTWTAGEVQGESQLLWAVDFSPGKCDWFPFFDYHFVRAVRSAKSSQE